MTEKDFILEIKKLNQIKPRKDWVLAVKSRIFENEITTTKPTIWEILPRIFFQPKLIVSEVLAVFIVLGVFGFSQNSLPGDPLYLLKRISEKGRAVFVSKEGLPQAQLELVNKRLEELAKIAKSNQTKKLAPALEAYQASVVQAAKDLARASATTSDSATIKKIANQAQKLEEAREKLERTYGIAGLEAKEESNPTKLIVEWLIKDLSNRTLTEEQSGLFAQAQQDYSEGNYSVALIKILQLSELSVINGQ